MLRLRQEFTYATLDIYFFFLQFTANMQNNGRDVRGRGLDISFNISLVSNVSVAQCQVSKASIEAYADILKRNFLSVMVHVDG